MPLPSTDTIVTFPDGATTSTGTVLHIEALPNGRTAVLLDTTACHPVDTAWPDQPADRGTITADEEHHYIVDAVTGGIHDGELLLGPDLPVRTGTAGWIFVVAHIIEGRPPAVGDSVRVEVDQEYRKALSMAHTSCHLAALALDAALSGAWTKPAPSDALKNPAFDNLAIQRSSIRTHGSVDTYRIGKSLRRRGFDLQSLDNPAEVADRINAQLEQWLSADAAVRVERQDQGLSGRRTWVCELPAGLTDIPCGGTHVRHLNEIAAVTVELTKRQADGGVELVMETASTPA